MNALVSCGLNGLMDSVEPGLACGSDTAHLSLLGYDPRIHYRGRGAFESMGAGLEMQAGDIAFKVGALE
jgi:2,3-bisphosphoglycerate-independent phosphoglycerate mutase